MSRKKKRKAQAGDIYVVTNDCYVKYYSPLAKKKVRPVKIGRAKDCVIRVGNMSSSVFDDFTYHLVLRAQDVVRCEDDIHDLVKDYQIFTQKSGGKTEFFHDNSRKRSLTSSSTMTSNTTLATISTAESET